MAILTLTQDNKLKLQCSFLEKELAKKISGAYYNREDQSWIYSFSKDKIVAFRKYFEDVSISDEVLKAEQEEIAIEKELLELKNLKTIDIKIPTKIGPFEHQKTGINFMLKRLEKYKGVFNMDEMGLGKTFQAIATALILKQQNKIKKVLIVCPNTIKNIWKNEIEKYTHEKLLVVEGSRIQREKIYQEFKRDEKIMFLIINYEGIRCDKNVLTTML